MSFLKKITVDLRYGSLSEESEFLTFKYCKRHLNVGEILYYRQLCTYNDKITLIFFYSRKCLLGKFIPEEN